MTAFSAFGRRWVQLPGMDAVRSWLVSAGLIREVLTANRTYYVRTDGSDSNNGLANTSGGAFLTIQKALNTAATIDFAGFSVTIQVGDGTYTAGLSIPVMVGQGNASDLIISGNAATPANVVVSVTSANAVALLSPSAMVRLQNFEIRTTTSGSAISNQAGHVEIHTGMRFGAVATAMIFVRRGGLVVATDNYTVAGNAQRRVLVREHGVYIEDARTITYSGTPAFSAANVDATSGGVVSSASSTQSGAATGTRYAVALNAIISTAGGGATFYPGNVAGTTATGGQYA